MGRGRIHAHRLDLPAWRAEPCFAGQDHNLDPAASRSVEIVVYTTVAAQAMVAVWATAAACTMDQAVASPVMVAAHPLAGHDRSVRGTLADRSGRAAPFRALGSKPARHRSDATVPSHAIDLACGVECDQAPPAAIDHPVVRRLAVLPVVLSVSAAEHQPESQHPDRSAAPFRARAAGRDRAAHRSAPQDFESIPTVHLQ